MTDLLGILNLYLIINISFISEVCTKVVSIHHNVVLMKLAYVFIYWVCFLNCAVNFGAEDINHIFYVLLLEYTTYKSYEKPMNVDESRHNRSINTCVSLFYPYVCVQ